MAFSAEIPAFGSWSKGLTVLEFTIGVKNIFLMA